MLRRFSGADNPNPFFIFEIRVCGHNEQNQQHLDHPNRMPSLLPIFEPVRHDEMKRIVEDALCKIECDTVLGKIALGLFSIPLELQGRTIIYNIVRTIP